MKLTIFQKLYFILFEAEKNNLRVRGKFSRYQRSRHQLTISATILAHLIFKSVKFLDVLESEISENSQEAWRLF